MAWNRGLFLVENPRPKIQIFDFQLITKSSVASSRHGAGTGSELSLFRRQHRPAAVNYLTLSVMPALIVSGARSMTALSSPAIQKPHLSQIPAASPAHTALLVPSINEIADPAVLLEIQVTHVAENGKDGEHKRKGPACRTQAEPYHM